MSGFISTEKNTRMLINLLKSHGIKKIVASPGSANVNFVGSVENDPFFEIFSCVDERSAAYMACGIAAETGEAVVLSCTGATASRNYFPGLTEAYYRKLPILAVTAMQHRGKIGSLSPQVIDRSVQPKDTVKISVYIPALLPTKEDEWAANVQMNKAILELKHNGYGPVHIDLQTNFSIESESKQPVYDRVIRRIMPRDEFPEIPSGKIGVFVGAHKRWSEEETKTVDKFCNIYNAVVLCDNTSNYWGEYRVQALLITTQFGMEYEYNNFDLIIHIGDVSGTGIHFKASNVWRISNDGEIRDTFKALSYVFEMEEIDFFRKYCERQRQYDDCSFYDLWHSEYERLLNKIPELPFSNTWVAQHSIKRIPENSVLHMGILNSLKSWSYFVPTYQTQCYCNTGGFGIDGGVSSLIGASLCDPSKLYFGIVGDLAFFYDMNSIGNRHIGNNIRIMMINNGCGAQFHLPGTYPQKAGISDEEIYQYISAGGHYGHKSSELVKHYTQDVGFDYMSASTKEEFDLNVGRFFSPIINGKPLFFEVFVDYHNDAKADSLVRGLDGALSLGARMIAKNIIGEKNVQKIKKMIKN